MKSLEDFFRQWEKENNPFYPSEMRWDRLVVFSVLKAYSESILTPSDTIRSFCEKHAISEQVLIDVYNDNLKRITLLTPSDEGRSEAGEENDGKNKVFYSALKHTSDLPISNMKLFKELAFEMMDNFATIRTAQVREELEEAKQTIETMDYNLIQHERAFDHLKSELEAKHMELICIKSELTEAIRQGAEKDEKIREQEVSLVGYRALTEGML